ncbi:uncharacterized protein LOC130672687 [Microplitis mediator]|uniref:uncharacterized protein LOC130672687 n=1 Tax=Microplitis mediator TaxID=375433 RepID=UPI002555FE42|nr:uncharacterized protein LOC130672687 [Microplitis mediator]
MYGIKHPHTTPYHPQANSLVERLHRQLKSALSCHEESWYDALPAVLLGLRAAWKDAIQTTQAELVYGEPIRFPGELLTPSNKTTPHDIINTLKRYFNSLASAEMSCHGKRSVFCFRNLSTCSHVLVRNDQVGPFFSPPYEGLFRVITLHDKYFIVDFWRRQIAISVDRLKPIYEANPANTATMTTNSQPNNNNNTATQTQKRRVRFNIQNLRDKCYMSAMGLSLGPNVHSYASKDDAERISISDAISQGSTREGRMARRQQQLNILEENDEADGSSYDAGIDDTI